MQLWKSVEIVHRVYSNIVLTLYRMIRIVCSFLTALGLGYRGKVLEGGNNVFTFFRRHFHILNLGVCGEENGVLSAAHLLCLQMPLTYIFVRTAYSLLYFPHPENNNAN